MSGKKLPAASTNHFQSKFAFKSQRQTNLAAITPLAPSSQLRTAESPQYLVEDLTGTNNQLVRHAKCSFWLYVPHSGKGFFRYWPKVPYSTQTSFSVYSANAVRVSELEQSLHSIQTDIDSSRLCFPHGRLRNRCFHLSASVLQGVLKAVCHASIDHPTTL